MTENIEITERAWEAIGKMATRLSRAPRVRLGVFGGGCGGYQYVFEWSDHSDPERDVVVERDGAAVVVDRKSVALLGGIFLDFETGLVNHGFRFDARLASKTCGCGLSFEI